MLEEIEYIHWEDVYKNSFHYAYIEFDTCRKNNNISQETKNILYYSLFNSTIELLRVFFANKGLFYEYSRDIIREAFRVELLSDGKTWMEVLTLMEAFDDENIKEILSIYFNDKYFKIFIELNNTFIKELYISEDDINKRLNRQKISKFADFFPFKKKRIPRWYYSAKHVDRVINNYSEIDKNKCECNIAFALNNVFTAYYYMLKDIYREKGLYLYYPVDILNKAQKDGIITDADDYLKYIKDVNNLISLQNEESEKEREKDLVNSYEYKIQDIVNFADNILKNNYYNTKSDKVEFPSKLIKYDKKFGIEKPVWDYLMQFFSQNSDIKRVWIHGSRIKGLARPHADIDLIIESPFETFDSIRKSLYELRIPYIIDAKNKFDPTREVLRNEILTENYIRLIYEK